MSKDENHHGRLLFLRGERACMYAEKKESHREALKRWLPVITVLCHVSCD